MNREELTREAIKYAVDYPTSYGKGYKHKDLRIAFLAGAEPREKRIAELEKENEMFKKANEIIAQQRDDRDADISILENRTEELEAQIEKMKWHKIADGDLPKVVGDYITNIGVLTYDHYGNNIYKWHTPFCEACDYGDEVDEDEVIAWCEIPKYTREIKENAD